MDTHLYLSCFRSEALIASHLDPESFGRYMAVGTHKLTRGAYLFFEVTKNLKTSFFKLSDLAERCKPHSDGRPRSSKYVSVYRVLEHVELNELGTLYLVSADGRTLGIDAKPYDTSKEEHGVNLYQQLCPLVPLIVSSQSPAQFGKFITNSQNAISVPRMLFADQLLDREEDGSLSGHLPYAERAHIEQCIRELADPEGKQTKTVSRNPNIMAFFRTIRRGFFVADPSGIKHYPFPSRESLEIEHAKWWRSVQFG